MTTSSHSHLPFGFHAAGPMPLRHVAAMQTAVAPAAPVRSLPEPLMPMCVSCGARRGPLVPNGEHYDSGARQFICAGGGCTPGPTGAAADAISSYDGLAVEAIAEAARDQARAEMRAELAEAAGAVEEADWFHKAWLATASLQEGCRAVHRLCAGRRPDDWLSVAEVRRAVEGHARASAPLTLTWNGMVSTSTQEDQPGEATLVGCTAALGGSAVLALDDDQRVDLAVRLLAVVPPAVVCGDMVCGTPTADLTEYDPRLFGGIVLDVVGTTRGKSWWCSPACAIAAMSTAGAELAAADQLAAITPAPDPAVVEDDGVARCARCGCTEDRACDGGCYWVPNPQMIDLCSACATPQELAYAALRPQGGQGAGA